MAKLLFVVSTGTAIGVLVWLFGGELWGGVVLGAVASPILFWYFKAVVAYLQRQPLPAALNKDGWTFVATCFVLILLISLAFRAYSMNVVAIDNQSVLGDGERYMFLGLAWDGQRFIAVGTHQPNGTGNYYLDGAVWKSTNGLIWTRMAHDPAKLGDKAVTSSCNCVSHVQLEGITHTTNGSLIVGWDTFPDGAYHGRIWRLRDGQESLEDADDIDAPQASGFRAYDFHNGTEVLAGSKDNTALIWKRAKGGVWTPASVGAADQVEVQSVRYLQGRWIAVGGTKITDPDYIRANHDAVDTDVMMDAAIWQLNDDEQWQLLDMKNLKGVDGTQKINDIFYSHGKWLAVGQNNYGSNLDMDAAIWESDDGENWHDLDTAALGGVDGWQSMYGAAVVGDTATIVGDRTPGSNSIPVPVPANNNEVSIKAAVWRLDFAHRSGARSLRNVFEEIRNWLL